MFLKKPIGIICFLVCAACTKTYDYEKFFSKIDNSSGIVLTAVEDASANPDFFTLSISNLPDHEPLELHILNVKGEAISPGICYKDNQENIVFKDEKGMIYLKNLSISKIPHIKGEPVIYVLTKNKVPCARMEYTPYPNEAIAKDGAKLAVTLRIPSGELYYCKGTGFQPFEKLTTYSESSGEKIVADHQADEMGEINVFLHPAVIGLKGGRATFTCLRENNEQLMVECFWGSELLEQIKHEHVQKLLRVSSNQ